MPADIRSHMLTQKLTELLQYAFASFSAGTPIDKLRDVLDFASHLLAQSPQDFAPFATAKNILTSQWTSETKAWSKSFFRWRQARKS